MQYRGAVSAVFGGNGAKNTDAVLYGALSRTSPEIVHCSSHPRHRTPAQSCPAHFRDFILFPQFHFTLLYFTLLYFILLYILISALYFILFYFTSFILELWIEKIRPQITAIMACCNTQMARHHFILLYFTLHYSCGALLHIISFGLH